MIYIVTEDNTSALSFWKEFMKRSKEPYEFVLETLISNGELKLGGNWTLKTQIRYADKHIKAKDTLFIAFDTMSLKGTYKPIKSKSNTKNTENKFNPGDIIRMGNNLCKGKGCKFIYTLYYCFEEMFIMNDEIINLCSNIKNKTMYKVLVDMHDKIKANQFKFSYFKRTKMYKELSSKYHISNREHLDNLILAYCTQQISPGKFKINKKDKIFEVTGVAACWIQECQDIQKEFLKRNEWYNSKRCNNCTYKYKNCSNDTKVTSIASSKCKNCIDYIN